MAKIRWSFEAYAWLRNIRDTIGKDRPIVAYKIAKGIVDKIKLLSSFPEMGYRLRDRPDKNVRVLLYGHYRIVYQIRNESRDIDLVGIFHGALDLKKYLHFEDA